MKAVTWQGKRKVSVEEVPDPKIEQPNDAVIRVTSTAICGSDLHMYEFLGMYMHPGDIIGHEPMGYVEEVGPEVHHIKPGDRVVIPFNISCGHCFFCNQTLYSQCETTQVTEHGTGAALFGYTELYGQVPGGQAEYLRVPQAQFGPIKVPEGPPDERFLYLSDVLPTAAQAVDYANIPKGGTVAVYGLGPIGQMASRMARVQGASEVIAVDIVPERLEMAQRHGIRTINGLEEDDVPALIRDMTDGRGPDSVIDAVGTEAHGGTAARAAQEMASLMPDPLARKLNEKMGVDRLDALMAAIETVRRGGTLSVIGVYAGTADPLPIMKLFDRQIQIRMGQANVRRYVDELMPLVQDESDPLGVMDLATHWPSLDEAPEAYEMFQKKRDGCIQVVLRPGA